MTQYLTTASDTTFWTSEVVLLSIQDIEKRIILEVAGALVKAIPPALHLRWLPHR